jgi:hypothetical protein
MTPGLNNDYMALHLNCRMLGEEPPQLIMDRLDSCGVYPQEDNTRVYASIMNSECAVPFIASN